METFFVYDESGLTKVKADNKTLTFCYNDNEYCTFRNNDDEIEYISGDNVVKLDFSMIADLLSGITIWKHLGVKLLSDKQILKGEQLEHL